MNSSPQSWPQLLRVAAEILMHCPDRQLKITVLNKALFYADLMWLRDHGTLLTERPYVAIKAGPVVASYEKKLVRGFERTMCAEQVTKDGVKEKPIRLLHDVDTGLPQQQREEIAKIADWIKDKTADYVSNFSHQNLGWMSAWATGAGTDINMFVAMQQIAGDDEWLEAPLTCSEKAVVRGADYTDMEEW